MLFHSQQCPVLQVDELTAGGAANKAGQAGASAAHRQSLLLLELLTRVSTFLRVVSGRRCLRRACLPAAVPLSLAEESRSWLAVRSRWHRMSSLRARDNASTLQSCHTAGDADAGRCAGARRWRDARCGACRSQGGGHPRAGPHRPRRGLQGRRRGLRDTQVKGRAGPRALLQRQRIAAAPMSVASPALRCRTGVRLKRCNWGGVLRGRRAPLVETFSGRGWLAEVAHGQSCRSCVTRGSTDYMKGIGMQPHPERIDRHPLPTLVSHLPVLRPESLAKLRQLRMRFQGVSVCAHVHASFLEDSSKSAGQNQQGRSVIIHIRRRK